MKTKTTKRNVTKAKVNSLTVANVKHVNSDELSGVVGKRIIAKKTKYGIVLTTRQNGGFTEADAIKIAECLKLTFNGRCIR